MRPIDTTRYIVSPFSPHRLTYYLSDFRFTATYAEPRLRLLRHAAASAAISPVAGQIAATSALSALRQRYAATLRLPPPPAAITPPRFLHIAATLPYASRRQPMPLAAAAERCSSRCFRQAGWLLQKQLIAAENIADAGLRFDIFTIELMSHFVTPTEVTCSRGAAGALRECCARREALLMRYVAADTSLMSPASDII